MSLRFIDLFCGAGGFSYGFEQAGHTSLAGFDNNPDAVDTYTRNHVGNGYEIDLAESDPLDVLYKHGYHETDVDAIIGGSPCQGFSRLLGRREDDRNGLIWTFPRWVEACDPDVVVMENVPNIGSEDIKSLGEWFSEAGYKVCPMTLIASHYNVPQKRARVFFVAAKDVAPMRPMTTSDNNEPTVEQAIGHLPPLLSGESDPTDWMHTAPNHRSDTVSRIRETPQGESPSSFESDRRLVSDEPAWTITADSSSLRNTHPTQPRGLTLRERSLLQSFPYGFEWLKTHTKTSLERQIGNAVPPKLAEEIGAMVGAY